MPGFILTHVNSLQENQIVVGETTGDSRTKAEAAETKKKGRRSPRGPPPPQEKEVQKEGTVALAAPGKEAKQIRRLKRLFQKPSLSTSRDEKVFERKPKNDNDFVRNFFKMIDI